jgi:putrescine transport system ATP-binding protein
MAALDRKLREETRFELMHLQEKLGLTFIIVTHDQQEAMTVAHRMAVMNRGRLIQVATPAEIYEQPASRWVADFIGNVNLIEGQVVQTEAAGTLVTSAGAGRLRSSAACTCTTGDTVWVALRPEKVRIAREPPALAGDNGAAGRVVDVAYLGDLSIYNVRLDSGLLMKSAIANITHLLERPIGWDDRVWLTWNPDAVVVLRE